MATTEPPPCLTNEVVTVDWIFGVLSLWTGTWLLGFSGSPEVLPRAKSSEVVDLKYSLDHVTHQHDLRCSYKGSFFSSPDDFGFTVSVNLDHFDPPGWIVVLLVLLLFLLLLYSFLLLWPPHDTGDVNHPQELSSINKFFPIPFEFLRKSREIIHQLHTFIKQDHFDQCSWKGQTAKFWTHDLKHWDRGSF